MSRKPLLIASVIIMVMLTAALARQGMMHADRNAANLPPGLKFSHKLHVQGQGVACQDCHTTVLASTQSSDRLLGDHSTCSTCHGDVISGNCSYCHTDTSNIRPMQKPEREMVFSHALHADKHQIACVSCHAGIDSVETVIPVAMPAMELCMDCHEQQQQSIQCRTCHSDVTSLIPDDHLRTDFRKDHKRMVRAGTVEITCAQCHDETFCQDCHTGTELRSFTELGGLMSDPSPRHSISSSPNQLRLQMVHDLNYRYTHAIDARTKQFDCTTCHEDGFCTRCHQAGTLTETRVRPASHDQAGFTTLGRGSGGGLHATLARRDIESCAACHNVQGADPVCTTCHNTDGTVR